MKVVGGLTHQKQYLLFSKAAYEYNQKGVIYTNYKGETNLTS